MLKRSQGSPPPNTGDPKETKRKRSSSGSGDSESPGEMAGSSADDAPPPAIAAGRTSSDGSDGSRHTGRSDHSSQQNVDPLRVQSIFVSSHVAFTNEDAPSIHFYLNAEQRPDTRIQGQGDHITSYTLIVQALLASAEDNIRGAIISIKKLAEATLEKAELLEFNKIVEPLLHTHGQRKKAVKLLEETEGKEVASLFNKEIKYAKMSVLSNYLAQLTSHLLKGLQQHELATTFSKGRRGKDPQEGANAKTAARALVAINQIYEWAAMDPNDFDDERIDKMLHALSSKKLNNPADTEEQHVIRYGISALHEKDGGDTADKLIREIRNARTDSNKIKQIWNNVGARLKREVDKIASLVGDLYDYRRVLKFDLNEAFPLPQNIVKQGDAAILKYWEDNLASVFSEGYFFDIDVNNRSATITRTKDEKLIQTIDRHLTIIKSTFPEVLKNIDFAKIKDTFIKNTILNDQDWGKHSTDEGPLNLSYINRKLSESKSSKLLLPDSGSSSHPT